MSGQGTQDTASGIAYGWAERTFKIRDKHVGFAKPAKVAPFSFLLDVAGVPIAVSSDGIGTKVEVAERTNRYDTLGYDLLAMVIDDLAANAIEPVAVTNTLDVDKLDLAIVDELMRGLHDAATAAKVIIGGGEIAELGNRIGGYGGRMHFNWCATAVGTIPTGDPYVDGSAIAPGDAIYAIPSAGLRSNGFSRARQILESAFGPQWHEVAFEGKTWGSWLLTPCELYAPMVRIVREAGIPMKGLAHITGGGIPNKLGRTLKATGCGAAITAPLFAPTFVTELVRLGDVSPSEAYRTWNMGNGFMLVVDESSGEKIRALPIGAMRVGTVTKDANIHVGATKFPRGDL